GAPTGGGQFQARFGTEPFAVQTQWLAEHRDDLEIPFVTHLGDVVDRHSTVAEWELASAAMATLEAAELPYSILAGNHDVSNGCDSLACSDATRNPATERYDDHFPTSRAEGQATFGGRDP